MKLAFVVLSVLATMTISVTGNIELIKKFAKAKEACKDTGVTPEDMRNVMRIQVPQTKTGQCFAACVGQQMGFITDNKINMAQIKTLSADMKDKNPPMYDHIMKTVEACANETDNDNCIAAKKIMECVHQGMAKE